MNLALHGFLLQVVLSILDFEYGGLCSAGEPGYLDFDNLPETNFSCQGKVIGGYYADVEAGCQMFHVCTIGQKDEIMDIKFLCLNGTVFDQETRVCERVDEVDCTKSERFYNLNLELYGNNAVTLSLHEENDDEDEPPILIESHHQTTSARPSTSSTSTTTSPRPSISSTTSNSGLYQHATGYPQHFQPQPPFPPVQTSQSNSQYDDKNGGYHRQYIYHTDDQQNRNSANNENQATSYQLFSNQGASSTTGAPQIHHISTVSPHYRPTSTIQTLLNGNSNNPSIINPLFHNHGIVSTTEQFTVHNNNPRETSAYRDSSSNGGRKNEEQQIQSTSQGKVTKLISPDSQRDIEKIKQSTSESVSQTSQRHRISGTYLTLPSSNGGATVRSFYPTPKTSKSQTITQHIHLPPPPPIPQLKPHQVTINLPPPEIQRIVQNPSPLLPTQSRVIVTAKASVSDESGRPLNTTQLVTLPLPTIPASYDDYKEGDESFDPFYRDVPKVRNSRGSWSGFSWSSDDFRIFLDQRRKRRSAPDSEQKKIVIDAEKSNDGEYVDLSSNESSGLSEDYSIVGIEKKVDYDSREKLDEAITLEDYSEELYENDKNISRLIQDEKDSNEIGRTEKQSEDSTTFAEDAYYGSEEYVFPEEDENNGNITSDQDFADFDVPKSVEEVETQVPTENPTTMFYFDNVTEISVINGSNSDNKNDEASTDSVLKFTGEIPGLEEEKEVVDVVGKSHISESLEDYVDDNYEPDTYVDQQKPPEAPIDNSDSKTEVTLVKSVTENIEGSSSTEDTTSPTIPPSPETTMFPSTTTTMSTLPTSSSTTETPTTKMIYSTTRRFSTTPSNIFRPKQPKSYTPRINYSNINIPSSTPIPPVIIKSRFSLLNPKPSKPIKSYNEQAPKPMIRRLSLSAKRNWKTTLPSDYYEIMTSTEFQPKLPFEQILEAERTVMDRITSTLKVGMDPLNSEIGISISMTSPKPAEQLKTEGTVGESSGSDNRVSETFQKPRFSDSITKVQQEGSKEPESITNPIAVTESHMEDSGESKNDPDILGQAEKTDELRELNGKSKINTTTPKMEIPTRAMIDNHGEGTLSHDFQTTLEGPELVTEPSIIQVSTEKETLEQTTNLSSPSVVESSTFASVHVSRKPIGYYKRVPGFNCLEKEMFHFHPDERDCRLFHYCSPGFTSRQVLDFRFVCEEGTAFDAETQSCVHQLENMKCRRRVW